MRGIIPIPLYSTSHHALASWYILVFKDKCYSSGPMTFTEGEVNLGTWLGSHCKVYFLLMCNFLNELAFFFQCAE